MSQQNGQKVQSIDLHVGGRRLVAVWSGVEWNGGGMEWNGMGARWGGEVHVL